MKVSLEWLSDYVEFLERDPEKIADALTARTAEIEDVERQGALLDRCCVGKVLTVKPHPNADRLSVCTVRTDEGEKSVVCGCTNLRPGMRVALAHVGARVRWHGEEMQTLEKTKIRGEESEGMICTAEELDLVTLFPKSTGRTGIDLGDGEDGVGKPLREYLKLNDAVFHIDNHAINHRADLFSHIGIARECVALGIARWKKKSVNASGVSVGKVAFEAPDFPKTKLPFTFLVEAGDSIPRYCSCLLKIDALGETPAWMSARLNAVGIRSISLPIDITNYVMLDVGVPMHSFDVDDIQGDVHARLSKEGEHLQTLDGKEFSLPDGALVFSDEKGNFDLVGIMGGLRSSTKDTTRRIYLHALSLDPVRIRRTVIATGHRTEAATIYEKKVPHVSTEQGFYRALELFLTLVPGAEILSKPEVFGDNGKPKAITLSASKAESTIGTAISPAKMKKILEDLECAVSMKGDTLKVMPPLHRLKDITGEHDLIEEIARVHGYDTIVPVMPEASIEPPDRDNRLHRLRDALREESFFELVPLSLIGPDLLKKAGMDPASCTEVENPIGKETSMLAPSVLPGLLEHAERNLLHAKSTLRTFTVSTVFRDASDDRSELGILVVPKADGSVLESPFLLAKQAAEIALSSAGYDLGIEPYFEPPPYAEAGRSALLTCRGSTVGELFEVHPAVADAFGFPARVAAAVIDLTAVFALSPISTVCTPLPEFPAVQYDLTMTRNHTGSSAEFLARVRGSSPLLEHVEIVDLFSGKPLREGEFNLTIRCTYRAKDRTLTEEEAKKEFAKVEKLAEAKE